MKLGLDINCWTLHLWCPFTQCIDPFTVRVSPQIYIKKIHCKGNVCDARRNLGHPEPAEKRDWREQNWHKGQLDYQWKVAETGEPIWPSTRPAPGHLTHHKACKPMFKISVPEVVNVAFLILRQHQPFPHPPQGYKPDNWGPVYQVFTGPGHLTHHKAPQRLFKISVPQVYSLLLFWSCGYIDPPFPSPRVKTWQLRSSVPSFHWPGPFHPPEGLPTVVQNLSTPGSQFCFSDLTITSTLPYPPQGQKPDNWGPVYKVFTSPAHLTHHNTCQPMLKISVPEVVNFAFLILRLHQPSPTLPKGKNLTTEVQCTKFSQSTWFKSAAIK